MAEYAVSLMIASVIMLMCMTLLCALHRNVSRLDALCSSTLQTSGAVFVLMREFSRAPQAISAWKAYDRDRAVWNDDHIDIGICAVNNNLVCFRGTYDIHRRVWKHKTRSMLIENIRDLTFTYRRSQNHMRCVHFAFIHDGRPVKGSAGCCNKTVLSNVSLAIVPGEHA